jgi:hypothetical protein
LEEIFNEIHGEFEWEPPAQAAIETWYNDKKMEPVPSYGRLFHYNSRRNEHLMKLSMISAISAGNGLSVTLADFQRAQQWLFEAEVVMPDVFKSMTQKSDAQLLQDAHHHFYIRYNNVVRDKRTPISEREIWSWFADRTTSEKIKGLIEALEKTGYMRRSLMPGQWLPNAIDSRINSDPGIGTEETEETTEVKNTSAPPAESLPQ